MFLPKTKPLTPQVGTSTDSHIEFKFLNSATTSYSEIFYLVYKMNNLSEPKLWDWNVSYNLIPPFPQNESFNKTIIYVEL